MFNKKNADSGPRVDDPRPWGMRGAGWPLFAVPVMFLVVVAMIAVFVFGRGADDTATSETTVTVTPSAPPNTAAPSTQAPTTATSEPAPAGTCPTPKEDTVPAGTVAWKTTWEIAGQTIAPLTESGPKVKQPDGVRRCFDRSPRGAVAFAANVFLGFMQSPAIARQVATQQMTPGADRDQTLQDPGTTDTSIQFSIAGYRVLAWSPDAAQIELAISVSSRPNTWTLISPRIVWTGGDWKMDGANSGPDPAPLDSLATLTRWGAAS
ncbi:hypothetical protein EU513_13960 [Yimella sp. RIT 621]|uniref:hypothetical protein n=1 Tax=Yimella sp. RIT 621 TaxID=2510323 RepID=UPI00101C6858|nr:hypothetical protein [Yimella sp. RIT 621]RYG76150.1 hypothetical protein EU513_13960 [Yimella sp. RIT 621]